jgi:glutathione S-transferase
MTRLLYEAMGVTESRFSVRPFPWRILMACAHKELDVTRVPVKLSDKDSLAFSGQTGIPVFVDDEAVIPDSWRIACYLEETYPERPSLFGSVVGRSHARFIHDWAECVLHYGGLVPLILRDALDTLHPDDHAYFRRTREATYGMTLETVQMNRETHLPHFRAMLEPVRESLRRQPFLSGDAPAYADYIIFSDFQWARCQSSLQLFDSTDPIYAWRETMFDLFDGLSRTEPGFPV